MHDKRGFGASTSSGATLQQLAITPDSSKLLVVDPTDQAIVVFDLVGGTSTKVSIVLPSDPANTTVQPVKYVWRYSASADAFSGPTIFNDEPWMVGSFPIVDGDGGVVGIPQGILDGQLLPKVNILTPGLSAVMNSTGSLLYGVGSEGCQIVLSDTHNGRSLLMLQAQNTPGTVLAVDQPLAIDPTGTKVLLGLQNGLAYFNLDVVPLAVGTITPASAASGATIQVRGSGFVAGTTVTIGGLSANCSFVDTQTLSCTRLRTLWQYRNTPNLREPNPHEHCRD